MNVDGELGETQKNLECIAVDLDATLKKLGELRIKIFLDNEPIKFKNGWDRAKFIELFSIADEFVSNIEKKDTEIASIEFANKIKRYLKVYTE